MNPQKLYRKDKKPSVKFKYGFKALAERYAIEFRQKLGLLPYEFLCAFKLAEYLKVPIYTPDDFLLEQAMKNNLLVSGSDAWSAVTILIEDGNYIIVHNNTHSSSRQQSNLMHELAHIICKHTSPDNRLWNLPSILRSYNSEQEDEAIWLGGSLQLPRELLVHFLRKKVDVKSIAQLNCASEDMVNYRIGVTGVKFQIKHR